MGDFVIVNGELYHHGVKGMKWGVRKVRTSSGGISGAIRKKQRSNAERDLSKVRTKQKEVDSELKELKGYDTNPSKLGRSKVSTAIRRSQIKSLTKTKSKLNEREKDNVDALKELDSIDKYQSKKRANKAAKKLAKVKIKDLEKQYGKLEDQMTYGKNADTKKNARIEKQMNDVESQIKKLKR